MQVALDSWNVLASRLNTKSSGATSDVAFDWDVLLATWLLHRPLLNYQHSMLEKVADRGKLSKVLEKKRTLTKAMKVRAKTQDAVEKLWRKFRNLLGMTDELIRLTSLAI